MAAPKGNKYAVGANSGRKKMYKSRDELQKEVDEFFVDCDKKRTPYTITGLSLYLGFCSRQTLYEYRDTDEFGDIIKRACQKVENRYELNLHGTTSTGSIFALKNMGWQDKTEVHNTGEQDHNVNITSLPDDIISALASALKDKP